MGFLKKLIDKIKGKKTLSEKIEEKNIENKAEVYVKQESVSQKKFDDGLKKSSSNLSQAIAEISKKYKEVDESLYESIEELLISYDVGVTATMKIVDAIRDEINFQNVKDPKLIKEIIVDKIFTYYIQDTNVNTFLNVKNDRTNVILVTGVNGVGKTTSIAKIANKFKKEKKKILLVAGDTFRAGAVEQLNVWSQKIGTDIVLPDKPNQDPASVIYMGLKKGYEEKYDLIICDTSGRLQNKVNLMNELKKIHQVIHKFDNSAPHEVLLVLDATTGQSGIIQAKAFKEITDVTGIILAKMDSTSKGGIILSIKDNFDIPVKYIGLGEKLEDLSPFDLEKFIIGITKELKI
ncbi:signal recognition particle-docking protein FtsY [Malacoplasma iowae]|uniref:Signal recognition particle receptor FtsY n=2 Tax=Malacoplasma iowae TaxID=2116 RepID=A0A084U3N7_MALIO|nr:signal recognition particle-docking protein FtsY [Malacoplasma iowae]VEU61799.1 signal recognition particle-docking protein FtsY [Mycoplasmopsis fermentans]KFB07573.1 signal recognition particle docking protein FtsY [Malacoplasma iowae DK-CPA]QHG90118.1 signal recognition particle-docking protein FtsY [Malacoplasma iowae 695]WPL36143.1 signal recognition particle-docking protein FtsY [Malacoplasma iowae]WPL36411.1 signal recognition particle-docking protein FtsY [Malacoplasma iowae]